MYSRSKHRCKTHQWRTHGVEVDGLPLPYLQFGETEESAAEVAKQIIVMSEVWAACLVRKERESARYRERDTMYRCVIDAHRCIIEASIDKHIES
jgi:hypothetical protein